MKWPKSIQKEETIIAFKDLFCSKLQAGSRIVNGVMLDVSHISNHQIDTQFAKTLAEVVYPYIQYLSPGILLTAAASGPGLTAHLASYINDIDVIYAKKGKNPPKIFEGRELLSRESTSPTKGDSFTFYIRKYLLTQHSSFIVVDDFLRSGKTLKALIEMGREAGLELKGIFTLIAIKEGKDKFQDQYNIPMLSGITIEKVEGNKLFINEVLSMAVQETVYLEVYP